ncbi:flippase [Vibrio ezurae]|uniref:Putative polysaccharide biosynthesis protein n=1 Tax=Vibrio ezurae NBRC 102218 TaxID=1219080 RepID=U3CNG2_9VIBR|nr:flippase [Vibrio ezurae]GAD79648.1 putative polysaccharide biosynthesis protein [Vibrio ezurae NBRC 102218]
MKIAKNEATLKYVKNTMWLLVEKILRLVVALFIGIWIARYLGPKDFGTYSYAQSFIGLFTVIATLGLDGVVIRELVKNDKSNEVIVGTSFTLKIVASFFVLVMIAIAIQFTSSDPYVKSLIFIAGISVLFHAFTVPDLYFQAHVLSRYSVYANLIMLFISSILKIYLIMSSGNLSYFIYVLVVDSFVLSLGFIYFFVTSKNNLNFSKFKFDPTVARRLLKDSWPLILSGIAYSIYMKVDQVMIKEMLSLDAVGNYAAAARLSESWYFVPLIITSSIFPLIMKAKDISEDKYLKLIQKLFDVMVVLGFIVSIFTVLVSDRIIALLYGDAFSTSSSVLVIHIWAGIFVGMTAVSGKWLLVENLTMHSMYRYALGAVVNVILNIYLIERMGIIGAAYSTLISYAVTGFFYDAIFKETREIFIMKLRSLNIVFSMARLLKNR